MKNLLFILPALIVCAGKMFAADFTTDFSAANKLYAEGKFAGAAKTYEMILNSGVISPNLLFNDGNAEFKSGNLGRAIAAYRRAGLLSPRDPDVRANLEFVRNQVQGATLRESRLEGGLGTLTLNEWTALAATAFWLTFGLLAAAQLRPASRTALRGITRCAGIATVFLCGCLGTDAAIHFSKQTAVVVSPDAIARSGPFEDAQSAFTVHDGAELSVLDQRNGWLQATDDSGKIGWLERKQVEMVPVI